MRSTLTPAQHRALTAIVKTPGRDAMRYNAIRKMDTLRILESAGYIEPLKRGWLSVLYPTALGVQHIQTTDAKPAPAWARREMLDECRKLNEKET